jgi:hypothetical protein
MLLLKLLGKLKITQYLVFFLLIFALNQLVRRCMADVSNSHTLSSIHDSLSNFLCHLALFEFLFEVLRVLNTILPLVHYIDDLFVGDRKIMGYKFNPLAHESRTHFYIVLQV